MVIAKSAPESKTWHCNHSFVKPLFVGCCVIGCWLSLAISVRAQKPELAIQTGHSARINAAAYSPNGRIVASGGVDPATGVGRNFGRITGTRGMRNLQMALRYSF